MPRGRVCQRPDLTLKQRRSLSKKKSRVRAEFNLTLEEYEEIINKSGLLCEICHTDLIPGTTSNKGTAPCLDHNHYTGQIRGVLCARCNIALGYFKDSPDHCYAAFEYLRKYEDEED